MKTIKQYGWLLCMMFCLGSSLYSCNFKKDKEVMSKVIGDIRYELQSMPLEAYKRSLNPDWTPEGNESDYLYVRLRLKHDKQDVDLIKWNCPDIEAYNKRLSFFNNEIKSVAYLSLGEQLYYPAESLYENNYGVSPNIDIVMVFKKPDEKENLRFVFEDRIYSNQIVKFSIK